jgi:3alpha(or 20beta)-hydroxysteroid dehydrogenase
VSARASYITGAELPVDGGQTSHGGTKSIVDALARG